MISHSNISAGEIGTVKFVCPGVHTAEAIAPSGEKIYFVIETIEDSDKNKWVLYKNSASTLVNGGSCDISVGSLIELGSRVDDMKGLREFLTTQTLPDFWTSDQIKFEELCIKLRDRNISVNSPKAKELSAIPLASNGVNVNLQTHMVYVSKSPVIGRIDFVSKSKGYSGYIEKYSDLIMSVGVTISDVVENRGIFKNPLSIVEGGYAGIAMMAHSFTCMAIENIQPKIKIFRMRPFKKMAEIFLNSLPKDQVTVNGIRGDMYDKGFECEQDVQVPVKVVASLYSLSRS
jgi:hypothetical protein